MRTLGIDLAVTAPHKAVVADEVAKSITPVLSLRSSWDEITGLVGRAREGGSPITHCER